MMSSEKHLEVKSALSVSGIFGLRMLAVFMFIPIFTAYTQTLVGATPFLIGMAMGVYGLTQAIFQIPLGAWSDKLGRKPIIAMGLCIFIVGSLIGTFTHSMTWMIVARALQGVGAVGSTLMALLADLTSEKNRTKAMAVIGVSMGVFSALAIVVGPSIASCFGLSGVFLTSTLLTIVSLIVLYGIVPSPPKTTCVNVAYIPLSFFQLLKLTLKNVALIQLDVSILLLHAIFTALFYACPLVLKTFMVDGTSFYLLILGSAFLLLFPCIVYVEKKHKTSLALLISISLLLISQIALIFFHSTLSIMGIALLFFFIGFNFLEAALPSLISKTAPPATKGTAMGIYSSAQYLGIFIGGTAAGSIYSWGSATGVFIFTTLLAFFWLIITIMLKFIALEKKNVSS